MTTVQITQEQTIVLAYLKNIKKMSPSYYSKIILWGARPHDIIKLIENPEACGKWPFDFVCNIYRAISKISKQNTLPFPEIENPTEEDRVLSKLLKKNNFFAFGTNTFFSEEITIHHIIAYMERDETIYQWNSNFIILVQHEVKRAKEFLL